MRHNSRANFFHDFLMLERLVEHCIQLSGWNLEVSLIVKWNFSWFVGKNVSKYDRCAISDSKVFGKENSCLIAQSIYVLYNTHKAQSPLLLSLSMMPLVPVAYANIENFVTLTHAAFCSMSFDIPERR